MIITLHQLYSLVENCFAIDYAGDNYNCYIADGEIRLSNGDRIICLEINGEEFKFEEGRLWIEDVRHGGLIYLTPLFPLKLDNYFI